MRFLLLGIPVLGLGACFFDSTLPPDVLLECRAPTDCPGALACLVSEGRCTQPGSACITAHNGIAEAEKDGNICGPNSICIHGSCQVQRCGDGLVSGNETCDGTAECRGNCTRCGDGVIDFGEDCDDGTANGAPTSGACPVTCIAECGNGLAEFGEICDDGNANPADGCDACTETTWRATAPIGGNASAIAVGLNLPEGIDVDRSGNIFIADTQNHRIRRVDTAGLITTVAGTGTRGFSGDGSAATGARLNSPRGVAVDGLGNMYIADSSNNRIRRVDYG